MSPKQINIPALVSHLRTEDPRLHQALVELYRRSNVSLGGRTITEVAEQVAVNELKFTDVAFATPFLAIDETMEGSFDLGFYSAILITANSTLPGYMIIYTSREALELDKTIRPTLPPGFPPTLAETYQGIIVEFTFGGGGGTFQLNDKILYGLAGPNKAKTQTMWYRFHNGSGAADVPSRITLNVIGLVK